MMMVNTENNIFTLKFTGENIHPDSFTAKELANLLIAVEDSVKSILEESYPDSNAELATISLVGVKDESNSLAVKSFGQPNAEDALVDWSENLGKDSIVDLPIKAYKGIKHIHGLISKKKSNLVVIHRHKNIGQLLYTDVLPKHEDVIIRTETTIIGTVTKIGGDKPKVWFRTGDGKILSFKLTENQADILSPKLYKPVQLTGNVSWNTLTNTISHFSLKNIDDYQYDYSTEALEKIKDITSGFWDNFKSDDEITNYIKN